jgi:hypothetical protein
MIINKVTVGFVIQEFDTETRKFTNQRFIAGEDVQWEDGKGEVVSKKGNCWGGEDEPYLPFNMIQPYWPPTPKDEKPDPNIKPPAYQWLTEGYDPDQAGNRKKN